MIYNIPGLKHWSAGMNVYSSKTKTSSSVICSLTLMLSSNSHFNSIFVFWGNKSLIPLTRPFMPWFQYLFGYKFSTAKSELNQDFFNKSLGQIIMNNIIYWYNLLWFCEVFRKFGFRPYLIINVEVQTVQSM